ncbi:amidase [Rhodovarius crocodyli]|uniref:Amidase n=1 Tax=Rhodovarius crocodyli TaxID=1979269 RepID=A0A437LXE9_9PROT|nr:amidase [Rhodovarius crocodyli]RVT90085.1 amidase [Rhodovarius crocodyli]
MTPYVSDVVVQGAADGPLRGLSFAVKDLFEVEGTRSGWGSPDRLAEAPVAAATASVLLPALAAGATLRGKTKTDELACGMFGENPHDGAPLNPAAPGRVPGGSSSGSASAVGLGDVDFAFGTDTGGSVRVPASFCGLFGLRTTHGRLSTAGLMPMAPSFDTVGWLARDARTLRRVGECYFGPITPVLPPRILFAEDAMAQCVPAVASVARAAIEALPRLHRFTLFEEGAAHWLATFRPLQLNELWATHGEWATRPGRNLSPAVAQRIGIAREVTAAEMAHAVPARAALQARMAALLAGGDIIALPTAHDLPPLRDSPVEAQIAFRERTLALTCIASLCRLPQISLPLASLDGVPVGISLIAGSGQDAALLAAAEALTA